MLKKGTRLAGPGGGKLQQAATEGLPFELKSDKDLMEVSTSTADTEDSNSKLKKGTFYMIAKDLLKATAAQSLSITGHSVNVRSSPSSHGFDIVAQDPKWFFICKDKEPTSYTSGNAVRMCLKQHFHPVATCWQDMLHKHPIQCLFVVLQFLTKVAWMWRGAFDAVHGKITIRKPLLVVNRDLQLQAGKPVKLTRDSQ